MAIADEEKLKKSLASGKPAAVYLLFGDDGYLKKTYAQKIAKKIADPEDIFAYSKFSADCDLQEVYDAVMQFPITSEKKCVVLEDYDFEHCSKSDFDRLIQLLSDIPDTAVLIIRLITVMPDVKKSSKFKKVTVALEKSGGMAVRLDHRRLPELVKMLTDGAAKRGCKLDSATARYLAETAGEDIELLRNELDKLCLYTGQGVITRETVDKVSVKTVEASVYRLSQHILACDTDSALTVLDELFFMRVEPMIILYTVSSVYTDMFRIYSAKASGKGIPQVAELFGYRGREFVLDKAAQGLKKFNFKRLSLSLEALAAADRALKSFGADGRIILEQLTVRLIYIIVKGEAVD